MRKQSALITALTLGLAMAAAPVSAEETPDYAAQITALGGDVKAGAKVYKRKCRSCHVLEAAKQRPSGPHHEALIGRPAGAAEYKYSKAMKKAAEDGLVWDVPSLQAYLANPKGFMKGTRMAVKLTKEKDVTNVLAYLLEEGGVYAAEEAPAQ